MSGAAPNTASQEKDVLANERVTQSCRPKYTKSFKYAPLLIDTTLDLSQSRATYVGCFCFRNGLRSGRMWLKVFPKREQCPERDTGH